jgi:hypothetical protein
LLELDRASINLVKRPKKIDEQELYFPSMQWPAGLVEKQKQLVLFVYIIF